MWEKLVITSELLHAGPCKAYGQHVLQQQGYQIFFGKSNHDFIDKQDLFYENTKMHIVFILI